MKKNIVVEAAGRWLVGQVLENMEVNRAQDAGAIVLPFETDFEDMTGSAGWARRDFGLGVDIDQQKTHGSTTMCISNDYPKLHWAAGFVPEATRKLEAVSKGSNAFPGRLSLASFPSRIAGTARITTPKGPTDFQAIGSFEAGEWRISGVSDASVGNPGYYELGLYGAVMGVRLVWLAISATT